MKYHVLNGDALAEKFPAMEIPGQVVVIREAFIEGPLSDHFSQLFWDKRIEFVNAMYDADREEYANQFLSQLKLLKDVKPGDEICLWFEDDLFCQANMWFSVYYISRIEKVRFFRIFPKEDNVGWSGFGRADAEELIKCFDERKEFSDTDIELANKLWTAYVNNERNTMQILSSQDSFCFRFLRDVIQAHLERNPGESMNGRPIQTLMNILNEGKTNFYEICDEFWKREGIYGFGDLQVYNMLKEMDASTRQPSHLIPRSATGNSTFISVFPDHCLPGQECIYLLYKKE